MRALKKIERTVVGCRPVSARFTSRRRAVLTFHNGRKLAATDLGDCSCGDAAELAFRFVKGNRWMPVDTASLHAETGGATVKSVRTVARNRIARLEMTLDDGRVLCIAALGGGCKGWSELHVSGCKIFSR